MVVFSGMHLFYELCRIGWQMQCLHFLASCILLGGDKVGRIAFGGFLQRGRRLKCSPFFTCYLLWGFLFSLKEYLES